MSVEDKQAIMLHEQGYSTDQIAQVLNMDPSHVDVLVQKHEQGQEKEIRYFTVEDETHKVGPKTKLTRERFEEMKRLFGQGLSVKETAAKMGFSWKFLQKVGRFNTYDDLMEYREKDAIRKREILAAKSLSKHRKRMTEHLWNRAMQLKKKGMTNEAIADELGFSTSYISRVTNLKSYEDFLDYRRRDADSKKEKTQPNQVDSVVPEPKKETIEETLAKHANVSDGHVYVGYPSIEDSLARIAEALEKIAEQPKKRHFFKR